MYRNQSEESLTMYLREIGRTRLLSRGEEIELTQKIVYLRKLESIREQLSETLDREANDIECANAIGMPIQKFRHRLHIYNRAKDKMVKSNLRLVVHIAKAYQGRGLDLEDLIQEGNLGLVQAVEQFEPRKGFKFSTYAGVRIRQSIHQAIYAKSRIIRLPRNVSQKIYRIENYTRLLTQQMGRQPTEEELATRMEIRIVELRFLKSLSRPIVSLDVHINRAEKAEGLSLSDLIEFDNVTPEETEGSSRIDFLKFDGKTPEEWVDRNLLRQELNKLLNLLHPRDRYVVWRYYVLYDRRRATPLAEIARILNVTRERIRQILEKALRKLKHPCHRNSLKGYL